jgi:nicotinamidase-related amidase
MSLLSRQDCTVVIVDVQEGFRSYDCFADVAGACAKAIEAARILELPVIVSEQYPRGLGHSVPELGLQEEPRIEKTVFSAARADGFDLGGSKQALVCGIEAHVCVSQTVHDLLAEGVEAHVPADGVGSRHELDYRYGLARMQNAGAAITTIEAALFELLEHAGTPEFKAVQKLII